MKDKKIIIIVINFPVSKSSKDIKVKELTMVNVDGIKNNLTCSCTSSKFFKSSSFHAFNEKKNPW